MAATQIREQTCKVVIVLRRVVVFIPLCLQRRRIIGSGVARIDIFRVCDTGWHPRHAFTGCILDLAIPLMFSVDPLAEGSQERRNHIEFIASQHAVSGALLSLVFPLDCREICDIVPVDFLFQLVLTSSP